MQNDSGPPLIVRAEGVEALTLCVQDTLPEGPCAFLWGDTRRDSEITSVWAGYYGEWRTEKGVSPGQVQMTAHAVL